jgi:acetyltransferase-like isoleucine patch superfamily enzyme/membrane-bound metal-dependent hydrolase YbcI (DUF457 family)
MEQNEDEETNSVPSPLIHCAAGWALARGARSRGLRAPALPFLLYSLFAAMLPDADAVVGMLVDAQRLPDFHNQCTHCVAFALVAALALSAAARWLLFRDVPWRKLFAWTLLLLGSHLLLDWLTWGRGEMLLWPLSDRRFGAPFPLFYGVRHSEGLFSPSHWITLATESATLGAAALFALALRHGRRKRQNTMSGTENPTASFKTKSLREGGAFAAYKRVQYGPVGLGYILWAEFLAMFVGPIPGALGLLLRKWLYPSLFKSCGSGVVFGRNLVLRHARKISLGDNVTIDDDVVLDAKGDGNRGIDIGNGVYIGRRTIVYCKNGNIRLGDKVNISSNCQIFSGNDLEIGAGTVVAAFAYLLSGGQYDVSAKAAPFAEQTGMEVRGPTIIGENNWLGAGVVVVDGVRTGPHVVVGAGAVLTSDLPDDSLAVGVPAKVMRNLKEG